MANVQVNCVQVVFKNGGTTQRGSRVIIRPLCHIKWQSSGSQVVVQWQLSDCRVAVEWHSIGSLSLSGVTFEWQLSDSQVTVK